MTFTTLYTRTVKRRATGKTETVHLAYQTKSHSAMHAHLRKTFAGAKTYEGGQLYTDLIPGMKLDKPILNNGKLIAESNK